MADIYGRTITLGGVLSGELVRIAWDGVDPGMVAQSVQIASSRPVEQIMDARDGSIYLYSTIPQLTQISIDGLVTDVDTFKTFLSTFCNMCSSNTDLTFTATMPICTSTTGTDNQIAYKITKPRVVNYSLGYTMGNYQIIQRVFMVGVGLEIT